LTLGEKKTMRTFILILIAQVCAFPTGRAESIGDSSSGFGGRLPDGDSWAPVDKKVLARGVEVWTKRHREGDKTITILRSSVPLKEESRDWERFKEGFLRSFKKRWEEVRAMDIEISKLPAYELLGTHRDDGKVYFAAMIVIRHQDVTYTITNAGIYAHPEKDSDFLAFLRSLTFGPSK
jgi:uncharacterized protein YqgQ